MTRQILGSKGGGGSSFVTKPDTLRSDDSFEILLGLGSGRWKGLTNGLESLKINGIPMENEDGTSNFEDVFAVFADGNPLEDQLVRFDLGGGGSTQNVGTQLANSNASGPGGWVSAGVGTPNADFIDIRFVVQQLYYQDEKSIRENTATLEIEMRPSGTSDWIDIFTGTQSSGVTYDKEGYQQEGKFGTQTLYLSRQMFNENGTGFKAAGSPLTITGKTTSAFVKELRIAVPNEGDYANKTWEVRARLVEKDTVDNDDIQERRVIVLESLTAVINQPLGDHPDWDGQVWLKLNGKASDQFSGFPEVEGVFDTKICQTPPTTVWDPDTRQYTGATWDGSYEEHFTTDPAWQIKEFIEDPIHGLAGLQPGSTLDKWDALEASKYYSELVPDGKGGTHPRFNMNFTINEARQIEEMMSFLAGAVNSYTEDVGGGVWRLKVDKPENPVMIFTDDNIFGDFEYSHTDVDTRFNDFRGTFIDEDLEYETNTVRVFDQDDIDENGIRFTEIALVGCTNRQEALRRLMFRMRVSLNEFKIVSFKTNRVGRYLSPLNTILVSDSSLNSDYLVKSTSRFDSISGTTITLKRPLRLEVGVNYTINLVTEDKETITRTVVTPDGSRGDVTEIEIDSAIAETILTDSAVALEASGLGANPIAYRVISVSRSEDGEDDYNVTAAIIDSGKWNAMDNVSEEEILAQESSVEIDPPGVPETGVFSLDRINDGLQAYRTLNINWNRPGGSYFDYYKVEYRIDDGPKIIASSKLTDSYLEILNPIGGKYTFYITAVDRRGVQSLPLVVSYDVPYLENYFSNVVREGAADSGPVGLGTVYVDSEGNKFRYEERPVVVDGEPLVIDGETVLSSGWVSIIDESVIHAAKTSYGVVPVPDIVLMYTSEKQIKNEFPIYRKIVPTLGESVLTDNAEFRVVASPAGAKATIDSLGNLKVTELALTGDIIVQIKMPDGTSFSANVVVSSEVAAQIDEDLGGDSASSALTNSFNPISSTVYSQITPVLTVSTGANGELEFRGFASFNSTTGIVVKPRYRLKGDTAWTDVGPEYYSDEPLTFIDPEPGFNQDRTPIFVSNYADYRLKISFFGLVESSLSANVTYEVVLEGALVSGTSGPSSYFESFFAVEGS